MIQKGIFEPASAAEKESGQVSVPFYPAAVNVTGIAIRILLKLFYMNL